MLLCYKFILIEYVIILYDKKNVLIKKVILYLMNVWYVYEMYWNCNNIVVKIMYFIVVIIWMIKFFFFSMLIIFYMYLMYKF